MIAQLTDLISRYGLGAVLVAVLLYIVLHGEVQFRYPRSGKNSDMVCRNPWVFHESVTTVLQLTL
jgi:hypothetical protein